MKLLKVFFENEEFEKMKKVKKASGKTWRDFLLNAHAPKMKKLGKSKISDDWSTTIIKAVREVLELQKGDVIEWHLENDEILLKKAGK